jgi:hypothetical protein
MTDANVGAATAEAVVQLAANFLLDPNTYAAGTEHGFNGMDFYFVGRAGALGDVDAAVVISALAFFNPDVVRAAWDSSADVMPRREGAQVFADIAASWADSRLGDDVDWDRLAELTAVVVADASPVMAPLFAAWRTLSVPTDPKQAAFHNLFAVRELRMARHAAAVVANGLAVDDAVRHHTPGMAGIFGWNPAELSDDVAARWDAAETMTNAATTQDYSSLDSGQQAELVELTSAALGSVKSR